MCFFKDFLCASYCMTTSSLRQSQSLVCLFWCWNIAYALDPFKVNEFPDQCTDLLVDMSSLPLCACAGLWIDAQEVPIKKKAEKKVISFFQVG